jgi:uncharacterized iron-regulated protein
MKTLITLILTTFILTPAFSQDKSPYQIFNAEGEKTNYQQMMKTIENADIIFYGELHNNAIAHWLEYEISYDLLQKGNLIFGAEMFEADNQNELNLYLEDSIDYKGLDTLARLWPNYKTDYAPLVDLAKKYKKPFVATNIPRRYASLVYKKGFEALNDLTNEEKGWIAPLPIEYDPEVPCYKNMMNMMGMSSHGGKNLPKAQAIKDATMAYFIAQNYVKGEKFIHFNGSYHSDNHEGILWYLKKRLPNLKYITITTVTQKNISKLDQENLNKADFIIVVDENMTNTY